MDLSKISDEAIIDGCRLFLCAINPVIIVRELEHIIVQYTMEIDRTDGKSIPVTVELSDCNVQPKDIMLDELDKSNRKKYLTTLEMQKLTI